MTENEEKISFWHDALLRVALLVTFSGLLGACFYLFWLYISVVRWIHKGVPFGFWTYWSIGHLVVTAVMVFVLPGLMDKAGWPGVDQCNTDKDS